MSASNKKKLRKEQVSAQLTEKQLAAQKEAKKLKLYSIGFGVLIAVLVVVALWVGISTILDNTGILVRNTTALTVGDKDVSAAELNYYYIDAINNFNRQYGEYASFFGLDVSKPLNEQFATEEDGTTWDKHFLNEAKKAIQNTYAMVNAAEAAGHTLTKDEQASVDSTLKNIELYAQMGKYPKTETYLKAMYGNGATMETYREYLEMNMLAQSYYATYSKSLTYTDDVLREAEKNNYEAYSVFSYNSYYLAAEKFLEGGTTDENGSTTYSDGEKAASVTAAEEAAKSLIVDEIVTVEDLNKAIGALSINADAETPAASTAYEETAFDKINANISEWVTDSARKAGDKTYIANETTSTDADGKEVTTVNGYYVVMFNGSNDNNYPLANVRHILVAFEGGTADSNGQTVYSDEEKATAKKGAEEILAQWEAGEATEDTFAALANEKSDDGDGTTGGLYEDIYPGQMVENFENWCFDESRKPGDTGIVETEYGYHIMYYVSDSDIIYRDHLITEDLRQTQTTEWYNALVTATVVTEVNTKYVAKDLIVGNTQ